MAGFGTRFLPIAKTIQKEMLPVLNRPVVDYIVDDCIKAGIEEIIFILSEHNSQILHFYSENKRLEKYLHSRNKDSAYDAIKDLHQKAKFTFVRQPDSAPYGTATPVKLAKEHLKNEEAFLVFMGDEFVLNDSNQSETAAMIKSFEQSGALALTSCLEVDPKLTHMYGIAESKNEGQNQYLIRFIEKPAQGTAPTNLANISQYIFTPKIFEILETQTLNSAFKELFITDTINQLASTDKVVIHTPIGQFLDAGNLIGWLKMNLTFAKRDPGIKAEIDDFIKNEWLT